MGQRQGRNEAAILETLTTNSERRAQLIDAYGRQAFRVFVASQIARQHVICDAIHQRDI